MRFPTGKLIVLGALGTALTLFPADGLRALGLGEARVDSYLGQPLDVSIRLIEADAAALDSLTVAPASPRDYERLGVPAEAAALGMEVTIDRRVDPPLLRVRSRRAAHDPVIQFLVDARWSSGRVLREYTLFLDPPTVEAAPPTRRADVTTPRPAAEPASEPEPVRERAPSRPASQPAATERSAPESQPRPAPSGQVVGPVAPGQTLWGIAYSWRPDTSLTMNQIMLAILERNPQAFADGNVNRLLRGAELTMPELEQVRALPVEEADRLMRVQMQSWQQASTEREVPVVTEAAVPEAQPVAEAPVEPAAVPEVVHRLEVVPPESDLFDEGPAVSDGEVQRASNRLSELEDTMFAESLESDELQRHVDNIRDAIQTRDAAGLAVADEEMALFESRLLEAREAREESRRLLAEADEIAAEDEVGAYFRELEEELGVSDTDALALDSLAEEAVADGAAGNDETAIAEQPVAEPAPVTASLTDRSTGQPLWVWLAAGAVLIVLLLGAIVALRRRRANAGAVAPSGQPDLLALQAKVAADPENLAAHLALLRVLVERDDPKVFSDALDEMYRHVEQEEDPRWQEALNLAVTSAPDHPLLTPNETALVEEDEEGLDARTREMLGLLGSTDSEESVTSPDDYQIDSAIEADGLGDEDEFFGDEEDERSEQPGIAAVDSEDEIEASGLELPDDEEFDLAELSQRVDKNPEEGHAEAGEEQDEMLELSLDEPRMELEVGSSKAQAGEDDTTVLDDEVGKASQAEDALDLDFNFNETSTSTEDPEATALDEASVNVADNAGSDEEPSANAGNNDDLTLDLDIDREDLQDADGGEPETDDPGSNADRELEAFLGRGPVDAEEVSEAVEAGALAADDLGEVSDPDEIADEGEPELSDEDAEVKLDLARAYLSMDDPDAARTLLEEISSGGSSAMRAEARKLAEKL